MDDLLEASTRRHGQLHACCALPSGCCTLTTTRAQLQARCELQRCRLPKLHRTLCAGAVLALGRRGQFVLPYLEAPTRGKPPARAQTAAIKPSAKSRRAPAGMQPCQPPRTACWRSCKPDVLGVGLHVPSQQRRRLPLHTLFSTRRLFLRELQKPGDVACADFPAWPQGEAHLKAEQRTRTTAATQA